MTDRLNTHNPETEMAEPAEHTAAMLEKADQIEKNNQSEERPEWLPEKFKSAEDMAQAYNSLEQKLSSNNEDDDEGEVEDVDPSEVEEVPSSGEVEEVLDKVGLDFDVFQQEYSENGELSADAYEVLEEAGFPRSLVDNYIQGQEALTAVNTESMYDIVGGESNYEQMTTWATENMSEGDIDAFNTTIETGDADLMRFAIQGLEARYRSEVGNEPQLIQGNNAPVSGGKFDSAAELTAAMRDPRYAKDPAYRNTVAQKLARSSVF
jgi:hypothetical protein